MTKEAKDLLFLLRMKKVDVLHHMHMKSANFGGTNDRQHITRKLIDKKVPTTLIKKSQRMD